MFAHDWYLPGGINHSFRVPDGQLLCWKQGGFWSMPVASRPIRSWIKRERCSTRSRVMLELLCPQISVLVFAFSLPTLELGICFLLNQIDVYYWVNPLGSFESKFQQSYLRQLQIQELMSLLILIISLLLKTVRIQRWCNSETRIDSFIPPGHKQVASEFLPSHQGTGSMTVVIEWIWHIEFKNIFHPAVPSRWSLHLE